MLGATGKSSSWLGPCLSVPVNNTTTSVFTTRRARAQPQGRWEEDYRDYEIFPCFGRLTGQAAGMVEDEAVTQ